MMNEKEIKDKICELEREISVYKRVLGLRYADKSIKTPRSGRMGRPKGVIEFSEDEINFLKEHAEKGTKMPDVVDEFNGTFGTKYSLETRALYNFMVRQGMIKTEKKK